MFQLIINSFQPKKYHQVLHAKISSIIGYLVISTILSSLGLITFLNSYDIELSGKNSFWSTITNIFGKHAETYLLIIIPIIVLIIPFVAPLFLSLIYKFASRKGGVYLNYKQWYKLFFVGTLAFNVVSLIVEYVLFVKFNLSLRFSERLLGLLFLSLMGQAGKVASENESRNKVA